MGEWSCTSNILNLGKGRKWVIRFTSRPLYPRGKTFRYTLYRRLVERRNQSSRCGVEIISCLRREKIPGPQASIPSLYKGKYTRTKWEIRDPSIEIVFDKLIIAQLYINPCTHYWIRKFFTISSIVHYLSLSSTRRSQCKSRQCGLVQYNSLIHAWVAEGISVLSGFWLKLNTKMYLSILCYLSQPSYSPQFLHRNNIW
jgi:hypothetical protein